MNDIFEVTVATNKRTLDLLIIPILKLSSGNRVTDCYSSFHSIQDRIYHWITLVALLPIPAPLSLITAAVGGRQCGDWR